MEEMRVVTVGYGWPFETLLSVMRHSLEQTNSTARLEIVPVGPHVFPEGYPEHAESNFNKMRAWVHSVCGCQDGEQLLLADCDLLFLKSVEDAFLGDFDIAYTVRPGKIPINGGVIFVKTNKRSRAFMRHWYTAAETILRRGKNEIKREVAKFGGISQASLLHTLEGPLGATVRFKELPCAEWNSVDQTWADYDPETTRVIHIKGKLRRLCLGRSQPEQHEVLGPLMRLWRQRRSELTSSSR